MMSKRPNVLIICVDEMRADHMACAGNPIVKTPNLDRLAARGTLFTRSYCNNPICMPARASMFTGLLPRDHGVRANGQALPRTRPVLPQILAKAGYRTHAAGKLHLTPWIPKVTPPMTETYPECLTYWRDGELASFPTPYYGFQSVDFVGGHTSYVYGSYIAWLTDQGGDPAALTAENALEPPTGAPSCYKMALPEGLHYNRYIADSVIRLINESAQQGRPPFFAWCSFPDPHCPVAPPEPFCNMYIPSEIPLPARREGEVDDLPSFYRDVFSGKLAPNGYANLEIPGHHWQEMIALTYGMVSHIDTEIGRILDALDHHGLWDNTLIVFLSDHGDMMGDHGLIWKAFYTFLGCTRIPTIVSAPVARGPRVSDTLISQIDLMPSVLGFCGIPMPGGEWEKQETPFQRGAIRPLRTFPGRSWIELLDGGTPSIRDSVVIENDDPTTGLQVRCLITERYRLAIYPGTCEGELFDLDNDPSELYNLWHRPQYASIRSELIGKLLEEYSLHTPLYPVPPWNA